MTDGHHFNNILLGGRGGTNPGQFKVHPGGLAWKRQGGGKTIEIDKADVTEVTWMKVPRAYQLGVRIKDGLFYRFIGFREQDVSNLTSFIQKNMGISPDEKQLSVSGHNWGEVDIDGSMLSFMVGSKQAFEVSLADVAQTQMQGKTDVLLELHVDDTTGASEKDSLMDMSFHVPTSNTQFVGDENCSPAHILLETILKFADVGSSEEPVVTFDGIAILTPRGRYNVELHQSFLRLQGQANDFKIQYSSIVRLFLLPKSNNPHTFVVITLDPPIRKGQTLYPHIVIQFETEAVVERELALSREFLAEKYKDRLEESYKGLIHEVFTKVLRGLSGAKVTRPGSFRSCQDGYAVKSSLKAEDGLLYPLEKGFFFLPKPPTLILHEEIEFVEFERHGAGGANMSSHYFDLLVKLKSDQEHLFRNIQRNEYHNLFNFINGKHLKIMNLGNGQDTTGGVTSASTMGGGDWQELAQTAVIGLIFAFLTAKLISTVIAFKEDNLRITRSPPSSPRAAARVPAAPAPPSSDGSDSDWEGVESTELDEEFSAASAFVAASTASGTSVPEEAQLRLYGLYKIATEGPCTAPQPSALKLKARAKWNAWHKLGAMPTEEAMQEYITIVDELFPNWAAGSGKKKNDEDSITSASLGSKGPMGPVFSSLMYKEDEENDSELGDIHVSAREGVIDDIVKQLATGVEVNVRDSEGRTPLHWAVDRGHLNAVEVLANANADLNAQDNEGQTALHYAVLCEREDIAALLVKHHADLQIKDEDGSTAQDLCPSNWSFMQE